MNRARRALALALVAVFLLPGIASVRAESRHVFGTHFWEASANLDVMSHRTGWTVEFRTSEQSPSMNLYRNATAEGFTVIQRLDWGGGTTTPSNPADDDTFATQCANWAAQIKKYCRHYVIGNEMELEGISAGRYAASFVKVRNAIKAVQPDAVVIIGHFVNDANVRSAVRTLGPDGYDGVTDHNASSINTNRLNILDEENARPGVGIWVTEWGWAFAEPIDETEVYSRIVGYYNAIGASNANRARQIYCACWFVYSDDSWPTFSLKRSGYIGRYENAAFEYATSLGTTFNAFNDNPVVMTNLAADVADNGSVTLRWNTNVPTKRIVWYRNITQEFGLNTDLVTVPLTDHLLALNFSTHQTYEIVPNANADGYGNVGGRRYRVKTGPWPSDAVQVGPGRVSVDWATDWAATSRVEYGQGSLLEQSAELPGLTTQHHVTLNGLAAGEYSYRVVSREPTPDDDPELAMRSPVRSFIVVPQTLGDLDEDNDVDMDDYGLLQECYSGSGFPAALPDCQLALLDDDDDVDAGDLTLFMGCLSGADVLPSPDCQGL